MTEFIKKAIKLGNSAGVILPKKFLGAEVRVVVLSRPLNIKKEAMKILDNYLEDIKGAYILSHKPAEILVVSTEIKKNIEENNIKINFIPVSEIKSELRSNIVLMKKLERAETIINKTLILDLRKGLRIKKPRLTRL